MFNPFFAEPATTTLGSMTYPNQDINMNIRFTDNEGNEILTELRHAMLRDVTLTGDERDIETRPRFGGNITIAQPQSHYKCTMTFTMNATTVDGVSNILQEYIYGSSPATTRKTKVKIKNKDDFEELAEMINNE